MCKDKTTTAKLCADLPIKFVCKDKATTAKLWADLPIKFVCKDKATTAKLCADLLPKADVTTSSRPCHSMVANILSRIAGGFLIFALLLLLLQLTLVADAAKHDTRLHLVSWTQSHPHTMVRQYLPSAGGLNRSLLRMSKPSRSV